jgi:SAM-dependent methyltransferase
MNAVLEGYAVAATPELIAQFETIPPSEIYEPVLDLLPPPPARVVDIGAGTGRDAAWLASQGYSVLAVEPVAALREAGMRLHASTGVEWLDDRLPDLPQAQLRAPFDIVVLCAVWHHLTDDERRCAMGSLARLVATGGTLILSLRHGPEVPGRPAYPIIPEATVALAESAGFRLLRRKGVESVQSGNRAAGVHWTWLALTFS